MHPAPGDLPRANCHGMNLKWTAPCAKLQSTTFLLVASRSLCVQVREVLEETGFDASKLVSEQNALSIDCNDRVIKLYVAGACTLRSLPAATPMQLPRL